MAKYRSQRLTRFVSRDGKPNDILRLGESIHDRWRDLYHLLLTLSWLKLLLLIASLYVISNALFALAYLAEAGSIRNARPGSFADAFFFSVQTMATIGYGALYPQTVYAHLVVTVEAMLGLLGVALVTGLAFARFSRPTARVLFSQVAVVAPHDQIPTLMFRVANQRRNQIVEAQIRVTLVRDEVTAEGQYMRRFHNLKLVRSQTPLFALTWTVMHPIDEHSLLYGATADSLTQQGAEIIVTLTGIDDSFAQTIHTRHSFVASEILWNMRFKDILARTADGRRSINYAHFHDVLPL